MTRRALLASLIAGATFDPERLLFVPGKKLISIPAPPRPGWVTMRKVWLRELGIQVTLINDNIVSWSPGDCPFIEMPWSMWPPTWPPKLPATQYHQLDT